MTKVLYIIGLVCCTIMLVVMAYFAEEAQEARWASYDSYNYYDDYSNDYSDYSYGSNSYDSYDRREEVTTMGGLVGILFCLYFIVTYILGLIKVKRTVATVFNIIGISMAGIFVFVNAICILDGTDFDDFGPSWILLLMFMIPSCIIGLVQAVKYDKILKYGPNYGQPKYPIPKVQYGSTQPSYNPNHPSASGNVIPGVAPPTGHGHPAQDPSAAQRVQQQPPPHQHPPQSPPPQTPPPPAPDQNYTRGTDPQQTPPPQPDQGTAQSGGVDAPGPVPPVNPAPSVGPIDNDPIITDDDADDEVSKIDDL